MIVYQTDADGIYVGQETADKHPFKLGEYIIPGGCVITPPPAFNSETQFAQWENGLWSIKDIPPPPEPEPPFELPPMTITYTGDIWRRVTSEEAIVLIEALKQVDPRLQMLFNTVAFLDPVDPDYPTLKSGIVAALGEERALEVLAPSQRI